MPGPTTGSGRSGSYSRKSAGIPDYQVLSSQIKNDSLPRVMLLYGPEEYLIRWILSLITERYVPEATSVFNRIVIDGFRFESAVPAIEACDMLPLLSEKKIVIVDHFRKTGGPSPNLEAIRQMERYLGSVPDTTLLIFTMTEKTDAGESFCKAVEACGRIYHFDRLDKRTLAGFTRKYLRQAGASFTEETVTAIVELSGYFDRESDYTLNDLRGDIEKLTLYTDGSITRADVETIILGNEETDGFAFTDALSEGRKEEAFRILSSMLSRGGQEFNILGLICAQFEVMMLIQEVREHGQHPSILEKELRFHSYRIRRLSGPASRFSADQLKRALLKAYEIDRNVKTGVMDARLGLELFIAAI